MKSLRIAGQPESTQAAAAGSAGKAAVITLGCAKNQVDSEVMAGVLRQQGFEPVADAAQADVAIVNTCGFLKSAVQESIDCILQLGELKKAGRLKRIVVAGCMVERYRDELLKSLPEADSFILVDDILKVAAAAGRPAYSSEIESGRQAPQFLYDDGMPRELSTAPHTAYVKISEGCNKPCAFCLIPSIRGRMRSRSMESILREIEMLSRRGVREISLIAQDSTAWGSDLRQAGTGPDLSSLLRRVEEARLVRWQRVLYAYPTGVNNQLLDSIRSLPSVCEYLDIPLQHSSENVLRAMRRPLGRFASRRLVEHIRKYAPEISLRTTFITGFPGETEQDVLDLEQFISEGHFSSVGVFAFSREEGTPAFDLPGQLPAAEKEARRKRLMKTQQRAVSVRLRGLVGHTLEVLVDGAHPESDLLLCGRTRFQAPEVDGMVIINDIREGAGELKAGSLARVEITGVAGYDLLGTAGAVIL